MKCTMLHTRHDNVAVMAVQFLVLLQCQDVDHHLFFATFKYCLEVFLAKILPFTPGFAKG